MSKLDDMRFLAADREIHTVAAGERTKLVSWLLGQVSEGDLEKAADLVESLGSVGGRDVAPLQYEIIAKLAYYYKIKREGE